MSSELIINAFSVQIDALKTQLTEQMVIRFSKKFSKKKDLLKPLFTFDSQNLLESKIPLLIQLGFTAQDIARFADRNNDEKDKQWLLTSEYLAPAHQKVASDLKQLLAALNVLNVLENAKSKLSLLIDEYAATYHTALAKFYDDQLLILDRQYRELIERVTAEIYSCTLTDLPKAKTLREKLEREAIALIDNFVIPTNKFQAPEVQFPVTKLMAHLNNYKKVDSKALLEKIHSHIKVAIANIPQSNDKGIPFFDTKTLEYKTALKQQLAESLKRTDKVIEKLEAEQKVKTQDIANEKSRYEAINRQFQTIADEVRRITSEIATHANNEGMQKELARQIYALRPSIYSFPSADEFKHVHHEVAVIAGHLAPLKKLHNEYSQQQIAAFNNMYSKLSAQYGSLTDTMDKLKEIEKFSDSVNEITIPDYLSAQTQRQAEAYLDSLKQMQTKLNLEAYQLQAKLLVSELSTSSMDSFAFFKQPKTLAEMRQQSFSKYDAPVQTSTMLATELSALDLSHLTPGEREKFEERKQSLSLQLDNYKKLSTSLKTHYEQDMKLRIIKTQLLSSAHLVNLVKHANKIKSAGVKGQTKAEKIAEFVNIIENAETLSAIQNLVSINGNDNAELHREIKRSRSFFGFGSVTSEQFLSQFLEDAKAILPNRNSMAQGLRK